MQQGFEWRRQQNALAIAPAQQRSNSNEAERAFF